HRGLQDFLRAGAEHDAVHLGRILLRNRVDEVAVLRRAVERIPARLGELAEDGIDRGLAGPERILVAADLDDLDAGRWRRPSAAPALALRAACAAGAAAAALTARATRTALTAVLQCLGRLGFHAPRGQPSPRQRRAPGPSDQLKEPAA